MGPSHRNMIDHNFMATWAPKYDEIEKDQPKYEALVAQVALDITAHGTLEWETFKEIMNWKSTWVMTKVDKSRTPYYLETVRECFTTPGADRIKFLLRLPGVGVPVASTILHFIYPNTFPIVDRRTAGVLEHFSLLKSRSTGFTNYHNYFAAIHDIRVKLRIWSLRDIDRAIFTYHKKNKGTFGLLSKSRASGGHSCCRDETSLCIEADRGSGSSLKPAFAPRRLNAALGVISTSWRNCED